MVTLLQVRTVEGEAASFLDQMSRYFLSRGRMVTKLAKYPHVVSRLVLDDSTQGDIYFLCSSYVMLFHTKYRNFVSQLA